MSLTSPASVPLQGWVRDAWCSPGQALRKNKVDDNNKMLSGLVSACLLKLTILDSIFGTLSDLHYKVFEQI